MQSHTLGRPGTLLAALALAALAGAPADAAAGPTKGAKHAPLAGTARFLGLEPHGPLARVDTRGGRRQVASPEEGACTRWGRLGDTWRTLDRLGQPVGRARVTGMERYDVTNCDELELKPIDGPAGAGVFVSGAYEPLAIHAWKPAKKARRALDRLIRARDRKMKKPAFTPSGVHAPERLAIETPDGVRRMIVGGRALTVLRLDGGAWVREHQAEPNEVGGAELFQVVAVLDMDGDGAPEVVVHWDAGDSFNDFTLSLDPKSGAWRLIDSGISGSTA